MLSKDIQWSHRWPKTLVFGINGKQFVRVSRLFMHKNYYHNLVALWTKNRSAVKMRSRSHVVYHYPVSMYLKKFKQILKSVHHSARRMLCEMMSPRHNLYQMAVIFLQFTYVNDYRCFKNTRFLLSTIIAPGKNEIDPALASTKTWLDVCSLSMDRSGEG